MTSMLAYVLSDLLASSGIRVNPGWPLTLHLVVEFIPAITLVPRFILSLRKLYAHDLLGRRGNNIDTAFGLASASGHSTDVSTVMFADAGQNEGLEPVEEVQMEERAVRGTA